ncbi:MAG: hypothetical protein FWC22_08020 [Treponema sp.]|nr:hypothetical protein [Treponema sp.]
MKNIPAVCLFLLFFITSCSSIPVHYLPEGRHIPDDFAGIVHAGGSGEAEEVELLNYLGLSWTLYTLDWYWIETVQGVWNFSRFNSRIDNLKAAGIKVIGLLAYDVPWIHEGGGNHRYVPVDKLPYFLEYVRRTVENFKGRVDAWCIWNEPNFHFWTGTEDEFIELSRQTADVIRETDSDAVILGGSFNRFIFFPEKFIRKLFESGAMEKVDYVAFHPYEITIPRAVRTYERFRKIVDDYGFGEKIWITEMGFPTGGLYPHRISLEKFPGAVIKVYSHLAYAGAMNVLWFQLYDPQIRSSTFPFQSEDYFGLVRSADDHTSKAAHAYRLCASYMPNTTCYVLTPKQDGIPRSIQAFWFKGENSSALILWYDGGSGTRKLNIRLPGTDHLRHDIVTGKETAVSSQITIRAGREPVFITWQGSSDLGGFNGGRPIIKR